MACRRPRPFSNNASPCRGWGSAPRRRVRGRCKRRWIGVTGSCLLGTRGASPTCCVRRPFYARGGAVRGDGRDRRSGSRPRRHRQPRRQVDGRDQSRRNNDALPVAGHDARLRPGNRDDDAELADFAARHAIYYRDGWSRTGPNGRPYRAGRNARRTLTVSTMSVRPWNGASASTAMARLASDSPLRPCRFLGDVVAPGMPPVVRTGNTRARSIPLWRIRGDASSGGDRNFVDADARRRRRSTFGLEQKPDDRGSTQRHPPPSGAARYAAHVSLPWRRFQNRPALRKALSSPRGPSMIPPVLH